MKLARLWQPRHPLFWQMLLFNVLSSVCAWALRALPLNTVGLLLVGGVGLLNVAFGLLAAWALLRTPGAGGRDPACNERPAAGEQVLEPTENSR